MARKFSLSFMIALMILLAFSSNSRAITISADKNTDLGFLASGSSITINLSASDYSGSASKIRWSRELESGRNPGFNFNARRGDNVIFSAPLLKRGAISGGEFAIIITAHDTDGSTASLTFTGDVIHAPLISTEELSEVQAGTGRKYTQRLALARGTEPIKWEISGDLPEGISLTSETNSSGKVIHFLTGTTEETGEFPFTLIVSNAAGSDARDYTLTTETSGPRIRMPANSARKYEVFQGKEFSLDVSGARFTGTQPLTIDVDDAARNAGLNYDAERKIISGVISADPEIERFHIQLVASNPYDDSADVDFTLILKTPPENIGALTSGRAWQTQSEDINFALAFNGRNFSSRFRAETGSKPIKWEFFRADDNTSIQEFGGLAFKKDGSITGTPNSSEDLRFYVVASNIAGKSKSGIHEIIFGASPVFDREKFSAPFKFLNGENVNINLRDYITTPEHAKYKTEISISSDLPTGLSFDNGTIAGTLSITSPDELKRYTVRATASNIFGSANTSPILNINELPKLDPDGTIEANPRRLITRIGRSFRLNIPAKIKGNRKWRLVYDGEDVDETNENEIGDSGLLWNGAGLIYSGPNALNDGKYPLTVYLSNDFGVDTKTFTIQIRP